MSEKLTDYLPQFPIPGLKDGLYCSLRAYASLKKKLETLPEGQQKTYLLGCGLEIVANTFFPENRGALIQDGKIVKWIEFDFGDGEPSNDLKSGPHWFETFIRKDKK